MNRIYKWQFSKGINKVQKLKEGQILAQKLHSKQVAKGNIKSPDKTFLVPCLLPASVVNLWWCKLDSGICVTISLEEMNPFVNLPRNLNIQSVDVWWFGSECPALVHVLNRCDTAGMWGLCRGMGLRGRKGCPWGCAQRRVLGQGPTSPGFLPSSQEGSTSVPLCVSAMQWGLPTSLEWQGYKLKPLRTETKWISLLWFDLFQVSCQWWKVNASCQIILYLVYIKKFYGS